MFTTTLKNELEKRCEKNPRYSLRAFAKSLDIDVSTLSRFLNNKKIPSVELAEQIAERLSLDPENHSAFVKSVSTGHQTRGLKKINEKFHAPKAEDQAEKELTIAAATVLSGWYHTAILELTLTDNFKSDIGWIATQLGVSVIKVKLAVERMLELGLLSQEDGVLRKTDFRLTIKDKHITSGALRRRQKQWLELASVSLESDDISIRSHTSMTMAIDPKLIPEAKKMISEFNRKLCDFLEQGEKTHVYDLGIALFPLQKTGDLYEK